MSNISLTFFHDSTAHTSFIGQQYFRNKHVICMTFGKNASKINTIKASASQHYGADEAVLLTVY